MRFNRRSDFRRRTGLRDWANGLVAQGASMQFGNRGAAEAIDRFMFSYVGMKVEQKLSDFSAEKWKQNENMETETEICKTETKTEFF
jgi:hypothetical protein